ncbi:YidC/Oxa1 family membrane protein insertase [Desertimonas flava]|jgi:YidC/Oxa1 family membrane protein insertase|uniref:YidC/Oxa1 family membrane protein insertase n=1 Tax=Desertimonas flava TaxID=2064846 RepID=UPI000E349FE0|nr:YidC/Oxa1 family membrane protein insertase [Desertimonas flava]
MIAGIFEYATKPMEWFYALTGNYAASISLVAALVMLLITPLTLKSTKGMLEMQRLAPEMRRLQNQYRNDRTKLNEEMMKLYQEHKVNPMSSCLPLLAQMPVFIIMFRTLHGLTYRPTGEPAPLAHAVYTAAGQPQAELGFLPRYISHSSDLFLDLVGRTEMRSIGLDLARTPVDALGDSFGTGLIYVLIVAILGGLYFVQQRMVAARAAVSPTMSASQQKLMQYLPVAFAIFQVFFLLGLVIYYMAQAVLRIAQQAYITRRFYGHDEALGRQAQRAGERARELAKSDGEEGGGGLLAQARRDLASARGEKSGASGKPAKGGTPTAATTSANRRPTKRTTEPKGRPTPTGKGPAGRPQRSSSSDRPGGPRAKSSGKRRR